MKAISHWVRRTGTSVKLFYFLFLFSLVVGGGGLRPVKIISLILSRVNPKVG